jgi:hypothetical protein
MAVSYAKVTSSKIQYSSFPTSAVPDAIFLLLAKSASGALADAAEKIFDSSHLGSSAPVSGGTRGGNSRSTGGGYDIEWR